MADSLTIVLDQRPEAIDSIKRYDALTDDELRQQGPPSDYDNFGLGILSGCPRQYYYHLRRFIPLLTPSYFTFGRVWGFCVSSYHEGRPINDFFPEAFQMWHLERPSISDTDNLTTMTNLLTRYMEVYNSDYPFEQVKTEIGFRLPFTVGESNYFISGSLDAVMNDLTTENIIIREDKSTGTYLTQRYMDQWKYATQIVQYNIIGHATWENFGGVMINMATKKLLSMEAHNVAARSTDQFGRVFEKSPQARMDEHIKFIAWKIEELQRFWDAWWFPKTTEGLRCSGTQFFSPCLFKDICYSGIPPEAVTVEMFPYLNARANDWAPWSKEGTNE